MAVQYSFQRVEKKYLLGPEQYEEVRFRLRPWIHEDAFGLHTISSIYYDTPDYQLIRTSLEHPAYKEKLRLRGYRDTAECFPEIKKKYRGVVYKRRIACTPEAWTRFLQGVPVEGQSLQIQAELRQLLRAYPELAPRVYIGYDRIACEGNDDPELRLTFDHRLRARHDALDLSYGDAGRLLLPEGHVVMEVKFPGSAPLWLARLLNECRIYPTSFSKYGTWYLQNCRGEALTIPRAQPAPNALKRKDVALCSAAY